MGTTHTESKKNWRELYEAGILEFDSAELLERISEAEQAVDEELVVLVSSVSDDIKRQKLEDAKPMLEDEAARCERLSSLDGVWTNTHTNLINTIRPSTQVWEGLNRCRMTLAADCKLSCRP